MDINNNAYSYCFCWLLFTRISIPSRTRFPPRSFWHLCPSPLILQSISSQSDKSGGATEEERESGGWNKTDGPRKEGEGEKGAPGRETCVDCGRRRRRPVREVWIDWDRGPLCRIQYNISEQRYKGKWRILYREKTSLRVGRFVLHFCLLAWSKDCLAFLLQGRKLGNSNYYFGSKKSRQLPPLQDLIASPWVKNYSFGADDGRWVYGRWSARRKKRGCNCIICRLRRGLWRRSH